MTTALANHLWQSTCFAVIAALLAVVLRQNHARARYGLWLAASLKFLVPFSLLTALGSQFSLRTIPAAPPGWSFAIDNVSRPFTTYVTPAAVPAAPSLPHIPASWLVAVWLCGSAMVLLTWARRWRRVRAAQRVSAPLTHKEGIPVRSTTALIEPGVFGIIRPVLLLPEGIAQHLTPPQLEAIFAHEMCHVRRRDNLTGALHMLVQAVFWFHPLIWWLGTRLVEERERACDEEVCAAGCEPRIYAEGILQVCRFYLESPIACAAGVTGGGLRKRIEHILQPAATRRLDFARKLLLATFAVATLAGPVALGLLHAKPLDPRLPLLPPRRFAWISIRPSRTQDRQTLLMRPTGQLEITNIPVKMLIRKAYDVQAAQITGGPVWLASDRFDIEARTAGQAAPGQMQPLLQGLLKERFHIVLHRETQPLPVYALAVAPGGSRLKPAETRPCRDLLPAEAPCIGMRFTPWSLVGRHVNLSQVTAALSNRLDRIIVNQTGLEGFYDFDFAWAAGPVPSVPFPGNIPVPKASTPELLAALRDQLGLELHAKQAPVDILVIDGARRPSEIE